MIPQLEQPPSAVVTYAPVVVSEIRIAHLRVLFPHLCQERALLQVYVLLLIRSFLNFANSMFFPKIRCLPGHSRPLSNLLKRSIAYISYCVQNSRNTFYSLSTLATLLLVYQHALVNWISNSAVSIGVFRQIPYQHFPPQWTFVSKTVSCIKAKPLSTYHSSLHYLWSLYFSECIYFGISTLTYSLWWASRFPTIHIATQDLVTIPVKKSAIAV